MFLVVVQFLMLKRTVTKPGSWLNVGLMGNLFSILKLLKRFLMTKLLKNKVILLIVVLMLCCF